MYKNVLLFYKRSAYEIYFLRENGCYEFLKQKKISFQIERFRKAHNQHYASLARVESIFKKKGIKYNKYVRGSKNIQFSKYDLVFSIGGDGTFLEAARNMGNQPLIGINSSPDLSVGKLCTCSVSSFEEILKKIIENKIKLKNLCRLELKSSSQKNPILFLNDILVAHANPASMSRYRLKIGQTQEDQRSSGLWIATPAGSTGAIHSAGGRKINFRMKNFQYMPRELYEIQGFSYLLKGGILHPRVVINILSLMRNGMIYVDGAHFKIPFPIGDSIVIKASKKPLKTLV